MAALDTRRVILGFVTAPALGLLAFVIALCVVLAATPGQPSLAHGECVFGGILMFVGGGSPIAYGAMIVFGLPLFWLFRRRGWLHWWQVGGAGSAVGFLAGVVLLTTLGSSRHDQAAAVAVCAFFGATGLVSGLVFWLIAVFRNRALDEPMRLTDAGAARKVSPR